MSTAGSFACTRWTQVLVAADPAHPGTRAALEELCRTYRPPLHAYACRTGLSPSDADDAVQGFFARLLRLESIAQARRERGRFRAFLLASLKHFLADARDRERAARRGSGRVVSLEVEEAAVRRLAADAGPSPDAAFDQVWALTLLQQVGKRLEQDYRAADQAELFQALKFALAGEKSDLPYAELAATLAMTEPALRVAVHRLRQRYRQLLREEIAQTVETAEDIEDELRHLRRAVAGGGR